MAGLGLGLREAKGYEAYMEGRVLELATQAGRKELEKEWKELRRGWYVGGERFLEELGSYLGPVLKGRRRESFSGAAKARHDATAAEAALIRGLKVLGLSKEECTKLPKEAAEKVALAWWVRQHTTVPLRWVGERLGMGHYSRVAQAVSRMRRRPGRKLEKFRRQLLQAFDQET